MAYNNQETYATCNAKADAVARLEDNGYIRIYDGTVPTRADDSIGASVLLAELRFSATSAPAASNGVVTYSSITADSSANATGTATYYRTFKSDGTTVVRQGTVGTSGADMNLNSTSIQSGAQVSLTSMTYTIPRGA